jgi:hypothetical protein
VIGGKALRKSKDKANSVYHHICWKTEFHAPLKPSVLFFFPCFLKSHPLCDQTGGSGAVFSWLYGWLYFT